MNTNIEEIKNRAIPVLKEAGVIRSSLFGSYTRGDEMTKESNPNVPWIEIAGMRNKLIHEYFDVDLDLVWEVVAGELPEFKKHILELTKKRQSSEFFAFRPDFYINAPFGLQLP